MSEGNRVEDYGLMGICYEKYYAVPGRMDGQFPGAVLSGTAHGRPDRCEPGHTQQTSHWIQGGGRDWATDQRRRVESISAKGTSDYARPGTPPCPL